MGRQRAELPTPEQIEMARRLRAEDVTHSSGVRSWRTVAKLVGVCEMSLVRHFDPAAYEHMRLRACRKRKELRTGTKYLNIGMSVGGRVITIPADVIADRERRLALVIDPIAQMLGVPPPGYSALDRKRAQASDMVGLQ